ncbi:helix-turn-helix domain-containing protein [Chryseobacterium wangxinyae]|uniref:helix-turn-helix domain-containing protein n=1 Tax=Chryseobacterium sp. CY353 TaxID=2997334 RepID=UPI003A4D43F1
MRLNYIFSYSLISDNAVSRVQNLLDYLKNKHDQSDPWSYIVPYTRKEMSSLTGLRIETVIRTLKRLQQQGMVKIIKGKIFY